MFSLIFSGIWMILWAITIIMIYYSDFYSRINHIETAVWYLSYFLIIGFIYITYKILTIFVFPTKKLRFGFFTILGITVFHIFILSLLYSNFPEVSRSVAGFEVKPSWLVLFFHILSLLIYPLFLVFLTRSSGFSIISIAIPHWRDVDIRIRVPVEVTIGFLLFTVGLLVLGSIGMYNFTGLAVLIILLLTIGFKWHKETYRDITTRKILLDNHNLEGGFIEKFNMKLLSIEFGYFFLTFLLGVALISIIRPMPIGWDDLGVYMNFPKIMAISGELMKGSGMYSWQLITGTGFFFNFNAAQAFYINQLWWILAVIAIISTLSYTLAESGKKSLLSLPILFAAIYYAMPMTVFQQAKDMKLDPAYLFFAISGFMLLFSVWNAQKFDRKNLSILALSALIIGFTFSVKVTSLMLILWSIWLISYRFLWIGGYFGFFFGFLAIFTQFDLWKKIFIWMPMDNHLLITQISLWLFFLSLSSFLFVWIKRRSMQDFKYWIISLLVFTVGVIGSLIPWLIKNISEAYPTITIDTMLSGSRWPTVFDYTKIYSQSEYDARTNASLDASITSDGQSQNEDFSRYFGQEKWLNNYMKLPVNLTFQKNQSWEFTDITYLFLALVPGLLLFMRSSYGIYRILILGLMIINIVYCFFPFLDSVFLSDLGWKFTSLFSKITLPLGYVILLAINFLIIISSHFAYIRKESELNTKFRDIMMFMGLYGFLFWLSAFGIVWYGIVFYFWCFLIIGFAASRFVLYDDEDEKDENKITIFFTLSLLLFFVIGMYFVRSAFPHAWNNLRWGYSDTYLGVVWKYVPKAWMDDVFVDRRDMDVWGDIKKMSVYMQRTYASAGFNEYKYNILSQDESIFANRSDYLVPIATMNIKNPEDIFKNFQEKLVSPDISNLLTSGKIQSVPLDQLHAFILQNQNSGNATISSDLRILGKYMNSHILYPSRETENLWGIYRIGTFMTYLINKNSTRYFDDSLVFAFWNYFYDPSPEVTVQRMQKIWLKYLLVDLNAATIDQDPRRALITRFEKLLTTMTAKNLKLVSTDNFCLQFAIEERRRWKLLTNDEFVDIAGTNYETYRDWKQISRNQKLAQCQNYILKRINEGADTEYPILANIKKEILDQWNDLEKQKSVLARYLGQSWFALFEITDLPDGFILPAPAKFVPPSDLKNSFIQWSGNTLSGTSSQTGL